MRLYANDKGRNKLLTVRHNSLLPTDVRKPSSGRSINKLGQRRISYRWPNENDKFSIASLYITRVNWKKIIQEYRDVFPEQLPKGIPPERMVEHSIQIEPGSKPSYRPPYWLGPAEQDELEEQIKDLLAQGFIQPSCSPYGAPVLFVPKKDGR